MTAKTFEFFDIFREERICPQIVKVSDNKWMAPDAWGDYRIMAFVDCYKNEFAFALYDASECHSVWSYVDSLRSDSLFDRTKHGACPYAAKGVYKHEVFEKQEGWSIDLDHCELRKVFVTKDESPLKFRSEKDFQNFVSKFDKIKGLDLDFVRYPITANVDGESYYIPEN